MKKRNNKKSKSVDPGWEHCIKLSKNQWKCKYCGKEQWGGITRLKHHLAGTKKEVAMCTQCPEDVKKTFQILLQAMDEDDCFQETNTTAKGSGSGSGSVSSNKHSISSYMFKGEARAGEKRQQTMNEMMKDRDAVCVDICRFVYENALAFNVVKSSSFKKMIESIGNFGRGLKPPSYHEVRVSFLKREVEKIEQVNLEKYRSEWKRTGCTLMSDGWTDGRSRSITNFLVNSPSGTVFLESIDTSNIIKNGDQLFKLLDSFVERIGEENVVQVVTDSASSYVSAGRMLEDKRKRLFWSPCSAHCINNMLKDIGELPVHKRAIERCKRIIVFIYRHCWVLNLMREFTDGRDLARPGVTRFATNYLTLKSILDQRSGLRAMFRSRKWKECQYYRKGDAVDVEYFITQDSKFWKEVMYCLKCAFPLVKVLRLVDGDLKPAMGYVYEAMDRAKEQIEKGFEHEKRRYQDVWDIIDARWELQLHRPLHAAGYFLNPKFHYDEAFNADIEVKMGLYRTIEKMYPSLEDRVKIDEQIEKFKRSQGMFGIDMALATRDKKQPALWWESYGEECKELQKLAIRVLSLTCSATGCERNWSVFEHVHSKRRNRLAQLRLNALVFVKYNMQLETRQKKREEKGEAYDPICLSDMESDDEWITEKEDPCLPEDNSWMDMNECFGLDNEEASGTKKKRKRGPRNLNASSSIIEKGKGKKKLVRVEEEDSEEFVESEEESEEEEEDLILEDDELSDGSIGLND